MVKDLNFVSPESQGVKSKEILKFVDYLKREKLNFHSFMFVKDGNILGEAYAKPFIDENTLHRIYSSGKTYVAMAIGKLIGDKLLSLDDKLISFFPEFDINLVNEKHRETTVRDALTMSVPLDFPVYATDNNWMRGFFLNEQNPCSIDTGVVFRYSTPATFILCVIIRRLTGKSYLEVLRPIFDKIGVGDDIWCVLSPDGYEHGGSGTMTTLRDFAKMGEFIMNKGCVDGEQLIPLEYMEQATSKQISTYVLDDFYEKNVYHPTKSNGYGFQMWMHKHGFCLLGIYNEKIICFPEKNFMFVVMGDSHISADYWYSRLEDIYLSISDTPLEESEDYSILQKELAGYNMPVGYGEKHSITEEKVNGATYKLNENCMNIDSFTLDLKEDEGTFNFVKNGENKVIKFGLEKFVLDYFPETHYPNEQLRQPANRMSKCVSSASWVDEKTLLIRAHSIDTFIFSVHTYLTFNGDKVVLNMQSVAESFMKKGEYSGLVQGEKIK